MAMLGHLLDVGDARAQPMAAESRYRCAATLTGHTFDARRRRAVEQSPSKQRVQVLCAAALSDGRVVSGSNDRTLKVWDASTSECLRTLTGHTWPARRRRPVEPRVARSSTPRGAQVKCVAVLPNGHIVSGSGDNTLKVWGASTSNCIQTLRQTEYARRLRPVEPRD